MSMSTKSQEKIETVSKAQQPHQTVAAQPSASQIVSSTPCYSALPHNAIYSQRGQFYPTPNYATNHNIYNAQTNLHPSVSGVQICHEPQRNEGVNFPSDNLTVFQSNFSPSAQRNNCIYTSGNMPYNYSDCRLEGSWNKGVPGAGSLENFNPFDASTKPNAKAMPLPMVSPGNTFARGIETQNLTSSQLASLLPYFQAFTYQQQEDRQENKSSDRKQVQCEDKTVAANAQTRPDPTKAQIATALSSPKSILKTGPSDAKARPQNTVNHTEFIQVDNNASMSQMTTQVNPSLPQPTTSWATVDKTKTQQAKNAIDSKRPQQVGRECGDACVVCGCGVDTQNSIDALGTVPSKMSVSDRLGLILGYPISRDATSAICPKCYHLVNEVDVLEHRLSVVKKEVLSSFEKNCYKKAHTSTSHHELQYLLCQNLISPQQAQSQAAYLYYSDQQQMNALNNTTDFHGTSHNSMAHHIEPMAMQNDATHMANPINQMSQFNMTAQQNLMHHQPMMDGQQNGAMLDHFQPVEPSSQGYQQPPQVHHNVPIPTAHTLPIDMHKQAVYQPALSKSSNQTHTDTLTQQIPSVEKPKPVDVTRDLKAPRGMDKDQSKTVRPIQSVQYNGPTEKEACLNGLPNGLEQMYTSSNVPYNLALQEPTLNKQHINASTNKQPDITNQSDLYQTPQSSNQLEFTIDHQSNFVQFISNDFHKSSRSSYGWSNNEPVIEPHYQVSLISPTITNNFCPQQPLKSSLSNTNPTDPSTQLQHQSHPNSFVPVLVTEDVVKKQHPTSVIEPTAFTHDDSNISKKAVTPKRDPLPCDEPNNGPSSPKPSTSASSQLHLITHFDCTQEKQSHKSDETPVVEQRSSEPQAKSNVSIDQLSDQVKSCDTLNSLLDVPLPDWQLKEESSEVNATAERTIDIEAVDKFNTKSPIAEQEAIAESPPSKQCDEGLDHLVPLSQPLTPEGLRNVQDATEYHKPTLLGKSIKTKKHAKLQICRQCDQVFSNRQALIRHIERRHKTTMTHSCITCSRKFPSENVLLTHMVSHKTYSCDVCSETFVKKCLLKKHISQEHSKQSFRCEVCQKETLSTQGLIAHMKTHTAKTVVNQCQICSKKFSCKRNLEAHRLIHSGEKPFGCDNCQRQFRHRNNMLAHHKRCTSNLPFGCEQCGQKFALRSLFERHQNEHKGQFKHVCSVCLKGFRSSLPLVTHFKSHGVECRPCEKCGDVATKSCNTTRASKPMASVCPICNKCYLRKETMEDHMSFHENIRNYECGECSSTFFYRANLYHHVRDVHQQKRPYACTYCTDRFTRASALTVHTRSHTKEKPFHCKACGKGFASTSNLKRHLKCHITAAHSEETQFPIIDQ